MNWLDVVVFAICIIALIRGFFTGFVMQIATLAGLILGAIFAKDIAMVIYPHIAGWMDNSENIALPLSYFVGFILILIGVTIVGRIINSLVKVVLLGPINKLAGAVFCMGKWIVIISVLLNLLIMFDNKKAVIKENVRDSSKVYPVLIEIAQTIMPYFQLDMGDITPQIKPQGNSTLRTI